MTYEQYLDGRPVVVTAALTGGVHGKEANPAIPETPEEIGRAAAAAEDAGAAVVHLHARKPNGERTTAIERFQAVTDAVRDHADDVVVQHSTGATAVPLEDRLDPLRTDPPPEMASLDMGPLNRYRHLTSENTRHAIDTLYEAMADRGVKPEMEVFNDGHRNETAAFLDRYDVADPYCTLIFGGGTTSPPHPRNLLTHVEGLPAGVDFNVLGFGPHQVPLTTMGLLLGGHVRVGLEDNVYHREGELAESSAQLVERTADLARTLGRDPATPAEARDILGIDAR
jgi:3-keto-5-aminohexanoate cleavage enzyme